MSKKLWNYLRSKVRVVDINGNVISGLVTDFVDEMDNDEQDEITILIDGSNPDSPTEVSLYERDIASIQVITGAQLKLGAFLMLKIQLPYQNLTIR